MIEEQETETASKLTWSHCIPTVSRIDILRVAVACSVAQTRPPRQIIVIDASADWEQHADELSELVAGSGIELIVEPARARSAAVQLNQSVDHVTSDIVLFTDDDSLIFPDYAEKTLSVFERDQAKEIVAVGGTIVSEFPEIAERMLGLDNPAQLPTGLQQKDTGSRKAGGIAGYLEKNSKIWPWLRREVLMMSWETMFIPYEGKRNTGSKRASVAEEIVRSGEGYLTDYLPGASMAVRIDVAKAERFNDHLVGYSPCNDADVSYRYGRHGACLIIRGSKQHHYEIAAGRDSRRLATLLGVSNIAFFIKSNSDEADKYRGKFAVYAARRFVGEMIKDIGSRRFELPQVRGVIGALPIAYQIFRRDKNSVSSWYQKQQQTMLGARKK